MNRVLVLATTWTLLLASCAAPVAPDSQGPLSLDEGTPQRGGTLQLAASRPPNSLYYYEANGIDASITLGPIFDPIIEYAFEPGVNWQIDHTLAPALAESWKQLNPTTYEFKLRQGARWHDGEEVTAEDVVFSYETIRNPAKPTRPAGTLKSLDTVVALDRYSVRVTSKTPSPEFLQLLASSSAQMKILPKHISDRGLKFEEQVIGTGSFKLESFERLAKAVLVRNDNYWREGPYLDKVAIHYGLDPSARLAAFVSGKTDVITIPDQVQFDTMRVAVQDVQFHVAHGPYNYGMYFKLDQPPFNDVRIRRAMHLAVDRHALIETITFGQGLINPPVMPAAKKGWAIPDEELLKLPGYRQPKSADLAEAKRLLAEAGYPNGFKTALTMNNGIITASAVSEMLAGQMQAIGIDMIVKGEEPAVWVKSQRDGAYQVLMLNPGSMLPDRNLHNYFHSKGGLNKAPVQDPVVDRLIEAQSREMNEADRKKQLLDLQKHVLDQVYHVPAIDLAFFPAWQPYVKHFVFNHGAQPYLVEPQTVWLEKP